MLEFPRESVRLIVKGFFLIADCKIEREELFRLSNLSSVKLFYNYKVFEILIVRVDRNKIISFFEIMPSLFKTINYKEHFLVVDFVILFRKRELTREKRYEMKILFEVLRERSVDDKVEGVSFYINR